MGGVGRQFLIEHGGGADIGAGDDLLGLERRRVRLGSLASSFLMRAVSTMPSPHAMMRSTQLSHRAASWFNPPSEIPEAKRWENPAAVSRPLARPFGPIRALPLSH
jgi:hypothetical protein